MKTDTRHKTTLGTRFRFLVRVLALFGVLAVAAGAVVAIPSFASIRETTTSPVAAFTGALAGEHGSPAQVAAYLLACGAAVLALWLLVEVLSTLTLLTSRKTASGTNAAIQVVLATALFVVVNALSFSHYKRFDNSRDREFSLSPELRAKLAQLDPKTPTTIVALRVHKSATIAPDRSDNYDSAAERKVVEKVKDFTDVLREFGPSFDVQVLDTEDEDFAERLDTLTKAPDRKALKAAIESAPENSIFFAAHGKVQRMGFNEFLLYDKTASKAEGQDKSERNLVLIPQGKDKFIDKLLQVESRKPVIGLAVIHSVLSSRSESERYSMAGLRVALERNGFEVKDIIVKNLGRQMTPAARTIGEDEFTTTEGKYNLYSLSTNVLGNEIRKREKAITEAASWLTKVDQALEKNDRPLAIQHFTMAVDILQEFALSRITSPPVARRVLAGIEESLPSLKQELADAQEKLAAIRPKYDELLRNDRLLETRRSGDVKTRFQQFTESCDLLIVPRLTVMKLSKGEAIQAWLHNWSGDQAEVLKTFIAAGKPVLFAVGPTAVDKQRPGREQPDRHVDDLLARFGVTLGEQAIFTDAEGEALAEGDEDSFAKGVEPPALRLNVLRHPVGLAAAIGPLASAVPPKSGNPLAEALDRSARVVDGQLSIRRSGFRPIYLAERVRNALPYSGFIASTGTDSWNEDRPLPDSEENYQPRFTPTKLGDPLKGTRDEERRGPFDVGVAFEAPIPLDWLEPKLSAVSAGVTVGTSLADLGSGFSPGLATLALPAESFTEALPAQFRPKPKSVRLVVLGHGGLFTGEKKLAPGEEALALHAINWQLQRDDKLPHATAAETNEWKYPRVKLDAVEKAAWTGGAVALLPLTCAVFGVVVLMIRRFR